MAKEQIFEELYQGGCPHCSSDLEWDWSDGDFIFSTSCDGCGSEYALTPIWGERTQTSVGATTAEDD